jgi:hypothetical protein
MVPSTTGVALEAMTSLSLQVFREGSFALAFEEVFESHVASNPRSETGAIGLPERTHQGVSIFLASFTVLITGTTVEAFVVLIAVFHVCFLSAHSWIDPFVERGSVWLLPDSPTEATPR